MKVYNEIMSAKLVGYTKPTGDLLDRGISDAQELIAYCARVSNPTNQINNESSGRLIDYLIKHQHWSPLEMAHATMEIKTTRDIARQILRHRSFSFQEFSQRYADPFEQFDEAFAFREARVQDDKNRQNSIRLEDPELDEEWFRIQQRVMNVVEKEYARAKKLCIAKEQRRALLPEGLTISNMYMAGSIRSWVHFIELRRANGTQKEHQLIAIECAKAIDGIFKIRKDII